MTARLRRAHGHFALPHGARCEGAEGVLVIRPEHLHLDAKACNSVSGTVSEIVYAGSETRIIAKLGDGAALVMRLGPGETVPGLDERIVAGWQRDKAVLVS